MPWRCPDAQLVLWARSSQRIGEDEGALLGKPKWRLVAAASIVEGNEPSGKLATGFDPLQLCLRDIVAKEEPWTESPHSVTSREEIDVANMIGLKDDQRGRRMLIEPLPEVGSIVRRRQWIEKESLALRLDAG
jgi:hypothetical protein